MRAGIQLRLFVVTLLCCAVFVRAAEIVDELTVNGITYHNVKWGPVNNGKVTIIHNKGVANIKLEDLPPGLATPFPYTPKPSVEEPVVQPTYKPRPIYTPPKAPIQPLPTPLKTPEQLKLEADYKEFEEARIGKVLYDGKLVDASKLTALTGFVRNPAVETIDADTPDGTWIELAAKRADAPKVAPQLELRPNLWKATGEFVLLRDYQTDVPSGLIMRVFGTEGLPTKSHRTFVTGKAPTFDEWKRLRNAPVVKSPDASP